MSKLTCPCCPVSAVLSWLSCPVLAVRDTAVLPRLSCFCCSVSRSYQSSHFLAVQSSFPVLAVLSQLSSLAILLRLPYHCFSVPAVLFKRSCLQLSCPPYHVLTVMFWTSYLICPVPDSLYCISLSRLSCPDCPVPTVLSQLSCPNCPVPTVLSQLSCPNCHIPAVLHGCLALAVLSCLFWAVP